MLAAAREQFAAIAIGLRVPKTTKTQIQAVQAFMGPATYPAPGRGRVFR